ncbi:hypothetical protein [uncultured Gimesia sp.]|uniref:hypothetical protein n=1 Tax=uncultured Gimesia sp. TaxID=1678688 RepID=UPI002607B0A7|nr:hypothetical protein [uncultured Gimesia sp.]
MAKRDKTFAIDSLIQFIEGKLQDFRIEHKGLSLRQKVVLLADLHYDSPFYGPGEAFKEGLLKSSARERIREYFEIYTNVVLDGAELRIVSGISDYPGRIRELRVEQGYRIFSGATPDIDSGINLKSDQFLLTSKERDEDAARRWVIANRILKSGGRAKTRLLDFFKENLNRVVTTDELFYVAKGKKEFARRLRELRTKDGFPIATRLTGRPDLSYGEYILLSEERVSEPHDRQIPIEVQIEVYQRDNNTCRNCCWDMNCWIEEDPRILEIHDVRLQATKRTKGINEFNLIVLCSKCHDEVHAGRLDIDWWLEF